MRIVVAVTMDGFTPLTCRLATVFGVSRLSLHYSRNFSCRAGGNLDQEHGATEAANSRPTRIRLFRSENAPGITIEPRNHLGRSLSPFSTYALPYSGASCAAMAAGHSRREAVFALLSGICFATTKMHDCNVIRIDPLPSLHSIKQADRRGRGKQQRCANFVFIEQPDKICDILK